MPSTCLHRNLPCLVFESSLTVANWPATLFFPFFFYDKHPPAYPAYSAFIRHCPFHYNILNDIKDHRKSSRNRNRWNRGNIKSRRRGPSRLRFSLFPIRSHREYYLKVPLRSPFPGSAPQTTPRDTHANLSRLTANLSWLIRKSAGN